MAGRFLGHAGTERPDSPQLGATAEQPQTCTPGDRFQNILQSTRGKQSERQPNVPVNCSAKDLTPTTSKQKGPDKRRQAVNKVQKPRNKPRNKPQLQESPRRQLATPRWLADTTQKQPRARQRGQQGQDRRGARDCGHPSRSVSLGRLAQQGGAEQLPWPCGSNAATEVPR